MIFLSYLNSYPWSHVARDSENILSPWNFHADLPLDIPLSGNLVHGIKVIIGEEKELAIGIRVRVIDVSILPNNISNGTGKAHDNRALFT